MQQKVCRQPEAATDPPSRQHLKRRATSPINCPIVSNQAHHQSTSALTTAVNSRSSYPTPTMDVVFDIEAMLQEAMDEHQRPERSVSPAYRTEMGPIQPPIPPPVISIPDIDECGARHRLPKIISVRSLAQIQPRPEEVCDSWERCIHCAGAMIHATNQCPLRQCLKCVAHGHSTTECPLTVWDIPYPATRLYDCPLPFAPMNGGPITAPRWAYLEVSPRILNHLYRIPAPTTAGYSQGRPRSFHILYDGILRPQETTITAIPLHGRLKEIRINCHYPGDQHLADLQVNIPVEGCNGLLNQLHTLELLQIRPWMDDQNVSRHLWIGRSTSTWPSTTGIYDNFGLTTSVGTEHQNGLTDRVICIRLSHECQVLTQESSAVQIPWIQLMQIRARLGSLLEEWRLYTTHEMRTMEDIKSALCPR